MKLAVLIVACMAIVAVQSASIFSFEGKIADKTMMEKQRFILEILLRVDHDLLMEEWIKLGGKLINDKSHYVKYNESMMKFYQSYKIGGLLPKKEFFSVMQPIHMLQAEGLFNFFYYAKDFETFVQNVAWARMNVNEGMFVYCLTMAVIHRSDMQGIIMPQIYEILPSMFLNGKYIMAAEKFDYDAFSKQMMLKKEMASIYDQDRMTEMSGNQFYMRDWKVHQWWNLMGLGEGWQMEKNRTIRDGIMLMQNDSLLNSLYGDLKMIYLPVDYTRDIEMMNEDSLMSYFTEDIGLNAWFYYMNLDYSKMLSGKEFNLDKDRRGELFIYNIQQLLARYYAERLSNGLGEFNTLSWYGLVKTGYNPQLMYHNGNGFTVRKNYYELEYYQNVDLLKRIMNVERRIDDIIESGKFVLRDGSIVDLTLPGAIEHIGNMMQGNMDVLDRQILGYWWMLSSMYLSGNDLNSLMIMPNVLMNYETMLRDPLSFKLFKMMVNKFYMFKNQLPAYTRKEMLLPGVEILDVELSKLMTYFDFTDMDITTLLNDKMIFQDGKYVWDKALMARQMRLNHDVFDMKLKIMSDKVQKAVVRIYMAPEFDQYGRKMILSENRENYMQLDEFLVDLVVGENLIKRDSNDFEWASGDPLSYTEIYNYLMKCYDGKHQMNMNISESHSMFPDRLMLPRGWISGMPMEMFFVVSPYNADYEQYSKYDPSYLAGIGSGVRRVDNMPMGYPLDRKIENFEEFLVPNMYFKSVKIYHMDNLERYYPMKYENYGKFDYEYYV
ncbi:larval serum protein 1 gamma chain-like [Episyrphus balteatus]|uniref:larval serum protein 1 gamma chain-like n=1 Tax=Episyrphus balteatus TaxID=286459 RepID=UPI002485C815|nr:larval serum protein 1 gamma chain-like [Episyrphus balteatus]